MALIHHATVFDGTVILSEIRRVWMTGANLCVEDARGCMVMIPPPHDEILRVSQEAAARTTITITDLKDI